MRDLVLPVAGSAGRRHVQDEVLVGGRRVRVERLGAMTRSHHHRLTDLALHHEADLVGLAEVALDGLIADFAGEFGDSGGDHAGFGEAGRRSGGGAGGAGTEADDGGGDQSEHADGGDLPESGHDPPLSARRHRLQNHAGSEIQNAKSSLALVLLAFCFRKDHETSCAHRKQNSSEHTKLLIKVVNVPI